LNNKNIRQNKGAVRNNIRYGTFMGNGKRLSITNQDTFIAGIYSGHIQIVWVICDVRGGARIKKPLMIIEVLDSAYRKGFSYVSGLFLFKFQEIPAAFG
jgi:hypothetical protein